METINTAVNGFGRIGMLYTRAAVDQHPELAITAINTGGDLNAHDVADRLDFDSIHRNFKGYEVDYDDNYVIVDGKAIKLMAAREPEDLDWQEVGKDLTVIESTGAYVTSEAAHKHIASGAKQVVITAPAKDQETITIVRGVNDTEDVLETVGEVVSVSSCSTNCIAPVLQILNNSLELQWATANVVHAYTNSQRVLDGRGQDLVSRRSLDNILPASTGSSKEIRRFFPNLPFHSNSFRVPVSDGSLVVLTTEAVGAITESDVIEILKTGISQPQLAGIVGLKEGDMFSSRVIGENFSAVVDTSRVIAREFSGRTTIELQAWFDNEWGYANRVAEVAKLIGQLAT